MLDTPTLLATPMLLDSLATLRASLLTPMVPLSLLMSPLSRLPRLSTLLQEVLLPLSLLMLATPMLLATPMPLDLLPTPRASSLMPMVPLSLLMSLLSRPPRLSTLLQEEQLPLSLLMLATPMLLGMLVTLPSPIVGSLATLV